MIGAIIPFPWKKALARQRWTEKRFQTVKKSETAQSVWKSTAALAISVSACLKNNRSMDTNYSYNWNSLCHFYEISSGESGSVLEMGVVGPLRGEKLPRADTGRLPVN